jgi:hypothetical protein
MKEAIRKIGMGTSLKICGTSLLSLIIRFS